MLSRRLLATLTVIAATAVVPGSAAARGSDPSKVNTVCAVPETDVVLTIDSHTRPHADGIIAILIGAIATHDDRRGQDDEELAAPAPLTAHLGSTKGSFIDGSVVYGSGSSSRAC